MDLKKYIRTVPDWPQAGIMFRDITTLLEDPEGFNACMDQMAEHYKELEFDKIIAIESRGFIFGSVLARDLNKPLILIRKPGKLPYKTARKEYELEYGNDAIEIHSDSLNKGDKVVVIDDLLATGGTAMAAIELCQEQGAEVVEAGFVIDLPDIKGGKRLEAHGIKIFKLIDFEGD